MNSSWGPTDPSFPFALSPMYASSSDCSDWLSRRGALELCLRRPPVSPDLLVLVHELLVDRGGDFIPSNYDSCTALSDPGAFRALVAGWEALKVPAAAGGAQEAEFRRLVGACRRRRAESWTRPCPTKAALLHLCHNGRTRLQFLADAPYPHWECRSLAVLIDSQIGLVCGAPGHPFYLAARFGSLEQLKALAGWCRPSQAAFALAAGQFYTNNFPWLLGQLRLAAPAFLPAVAAKVRSPARVPPPDRARQARVNGAVWEFLFLRLSAESAEALVAVTEENEYEIRCRFGWRHPDDDTEEDLLGAFTWSELIPILRQVGALALRFAWLGAVYRAPRRPCVN